MDRRWKHPFTCVIAGPTGSGKTVWVKRFLESDLMDPPPAEIIWCYGEWQSGYERMKDETLTLIVTISDSGEKVNKTIL